EIAIVHQHRFALFHWLQWWHSGAVGTGLVTIDWHDDVGGDCDFDPKILKELNLGNLSELALFCWAGLRSLNDGHIAPAMYLVAFGCVDVIDQQYGAMGGSETLPSIRTSNGTLAPVRYHRSPSTFVRRSVKVNLPDELVLDIDRDYFTRTRPSGDLD